MAYAKPRRRPRKKTPTVKEMMNQGISPAIGKCPESVKETMNQGKAKRFSGQGHRTVKSLMRQ